MNAIGIAMVWCMVQVTLVSLFVGGLYLWARWLRPAAAVSIVFTGLATILILSLLTLSPWPRWAFIQRLSSTAAATVTSSPAPPSGYSEGHEQETSAEHSLPQPRRSASGSLLRQMVAKELIDPPSADSATGWRWPAVMAAIVFAGVACRVVWLALGMLAVRWQRRSSLPVQDRVLSELIDVLCAELGCSRPIEVRQSDDLVTAATIGWRYPVLLLPPDWRTWNEGERRAVLAHEIAHARSHDCLVVLCGQLALMLHIYHPLLHWLASCLRLEQELAADAAAASVSGGQRQYLVTIAELALRQQDRPLVWPARTFLPTRTTFLRRISMLRDNKLAVDRLSPSARFIVVGSVVLGAILVAGLRGPVGQPQAVAAEQTKPATAQESADPATANPSAVAKRAVEKISAMSESDPQLPKVLGSLKGLDQDQVVTEIVKFLDSKEANMRRAAIYILWRGGFSSIEPAIPQLLRLCEHEEDLTRGMAALALGGNHVGKSLPVLIKMTTDDASGYARRCGAIALGFLGNKEATETLQKALKDPESMVRSNAQAALRMLDRTTPPAQPAVKDEHTDARRQALEAARAWLALTDDGKYAESWEAAAGYLKKAVSKDDFVKSLQAARTPLGKMISREVQSEQFSTRLPGAPEGQYVVIQFKTSLANAQSVVETVTPMLDKDGRWRVSGYYIK